MEFVDVELPMTGATELETVRRQKNFLVKDQDKIKTRRRESGFEKT
jgi:hypothetical protein